MRFEVFVAKLKAGASATLTANLEHLGPRHGIPRVTNDSGHLGNSKLE
jgi:hypothetical protein